MEQLRKIARNNIFLCFITYIVKYRFIAFFRWHFAKVSIYKDRNKYYDSNSLVKFKDSKKRKSCVIIGNGPSMRFEDLDRLQEAGIDTFGSNRIVYVLDKTKWKPTHLCIEDPNFLLTATKMTTPDEYMKNVDGIDALFFTNMLQGKINNAPSNLFYINCPLAKLFSTELMPYSNDAASYVSDLGSVTAFSIQIATYMGYKKIYLYGIDNTYTKYLGDDGKFHVDNTIESHVKGMVKHENDKKSDIVPKSKFQAHYIGGFSDMRKMNIGYQMIKDYADDHGIEIKNATHGGTLECFERVAFDDIF